MPFRSEAQRRFLYAKHPSIAKRWSEEFPNQGKLPLHARKKKKVKITVNNKLKEYGNEENGKIEINLRKHKGDKAELADTIHHELLHAKHPKASEKQIQKKTKIEMSKMTYAEKERLAAKVRMKGLNYKGGALKRKFKMGRGNVEPGAFINKLNESKHKKLAKNRGISPKKLGIMGLV